jgi:AraC family transcriptional regulator
MSAKPLPIRTAPVPRLGSGSPPVVLEDSRREWPALSLRTASDDITRPTDWRIRESRHVFVVHLGGRMDELETELDGHGGSFGAATPGEVWSVPAGRGYASHARGGVIRYAELRLAPSTFQGGASIAPLAGHRDDFLHHAVRQLAAAAQAPDDLSQMLAQHLSQTLALYLYRTYTHGFAESPRAKAGATLDRMAIRRVRDFLHTHLAESLTLDQLASVTGQSTHDFLIAFRAAFGATPWQYLIAQRLRRAQWLLVHTRKDIMTIALESGFFSHSHLTTTFRKHIGCTPRDFRARGMA